MAAKRFLLQTISKACSQHTAPLRIQEYDGACRASMYGDTRAGAGAVLWCWEDDEWSLVS